MEFLARPRRGVHGFLPHERRPTDIMTNPSDTPARAASPALPLALVHFGESIAAGTVAAVRSRDWRALLVLGVVAILLCRLATLVLRIRAGLLPAPRRASPSTQTPPAERRNPPASSGASARAVRAMANAVPAMGEAASLDLRPAAATGRTAPVSPRGAAARPTSCPSPARVPGALATPQIFRGPRRLVFPHVLLVAIS